jgi:hypothetical protein
MNANSKGQVYQFPRHAGHDIDSVGTAHTDRDRSGEWYRLVLAACGPLLRSASEAT